jgi:hypothetical protein
MSHSTAPSPYGTFRGTLFQYGLPNLVAFESDPDCPNKCILLGGLSDGLIPTPYTKELEQKAAAVHWSLVQPMLSSSYLGFGNGDLNRDSSELTQLLSYLHDHHGAQSVALVGHSTGCQNIVHWLKQQQEKQPETSMPQVRIVVLQAPVSDREGAMERTEEYQTNIQCARAMKEANKEEEMMPRSAFWAPITAKRFLDLQDFDGADDFFSSDLANDELIERLGHVGKSSCCETLKTVLVAFSGEDEFVAKHIVDREALTHRLCAAMNHHVSSDRAPIAVPFYIPTGNHNLSESKGDATILVDKIIDLLQGASND